MRALDLLLATPPPPSTRAPIQPNQLCCAGAAATGGSADAGAAAPSCSVGRCAGGSAAHGALTPSGGAKCAAHACAGSCAAPFSAAGAANRTAGAVAGAVAGAGSAAAPEDPRPGAFGSGVLCDCRTIEDGRPALDCRAALLRDLLPTRSVKRMGQKGRRENKFGAPPLRSGAHVANHLQAISCDTWTRDHAAQTSALLCALCLRLASARRTDRHGLEGREGRARWAASLRHPDPKRQQGRHAHPCARRLLAQREALWSAHQGGSAVREGACAPHAPRRTAGLLAPARPASPARSVWSTSRAPSSSTRC